MKAVTHRIREVFEEAGASGAVHARRIGTGAIDTPAADDVEAAGTAGLAEVNVDADARVVLASVFKIPFAVAYAREAAAGGLDPAERTTVTARDRTGGVGTAGCADDVEMSWRDLAMFMMTMSDNAATDVLYRRLGYRRIQAVLDDVGLHSTNIIGCCEDLFATMAADLGVSLDELGPAFVEAGPERIWKLSVLDPARTSASTPRDLTTLLAAIWTDEAGPPEACDEVRSIMAHQIWPHRLTSGFPGDVQVAGKTGTLPAVRNEAGVVTYPDDQSYAVAVFTRAESLDPCQPRIDAAIGQAARLAVEHLRGE
ncbi:serine hydrolase [Actinobacteria bacterium YIM 96077]|uniref:Serine hydrolase n=1 Tax=Phytoactinopolyspora halophila TaxID=1981511 RepID=A0A329R3H1_9ACTN|nr:serine hydrolase [Phytoactinopolyspora halophila]AYY12197.1 serine hydrolase [Actinobacteria bacterium YIM 96077]RAW18569.1 serine hydrolase [Phytoactinopolyspora halophila]